MAGTLREIFSNKEYYKIIHAILLYLTVSATAVLLVVLGEQLSPSINTIKDKYLRLLRDIDYIIQ